MATFFEMIRQWVWGLEHPGVDSVRFYNPENEIDESLYVPVPVQYDSALHELIHKAQLPLKSVCVKMYTGGDLTQTDRKTEMPKTWVDVAQQGKITQPPRKTTNPPPPKFSFWSSIVSCSSCGFDGCLFAEYGFDDQDLYNGDSEDDVEASMDSWYRVKARAEKSRQMGLAKRREQRKRRDQKRCTH